MPGEQVECGQQADRTAESLLHAQNHAPDPLQVRIALEQSASTCIAHETRDPGSLEFGWRCLHQIQAHPRERRQGLAGVPLPVAGQQVVEPDVQHDPEQSSLRGFEQGEAGPDFRMGIRVDIDPAVKDHAVAQSVRPVRGHTPSPEIPEQAALHVAGLWQGDQGVGKMVHGSTIGRGAGSGMMPCPTRTADIPVSENPIRFPEQAGEVFLHGPAGRIEAQVELPEPADARAGIAVICHPHPLHGGTMHNKVVTILERSLRELGLRTLRFNFRGVGNSEGEFDNGRGESQDLLTIVEWVQRVCPGDALWLAGFSFGSYVAARVAQSTPVRQLISIAPAVENYAFDGMNRAGCPWLVIQGEDDEVVSPDAVYAWAESMGEAVQLIRMPGTGHFFHRRLMDLRGAIKNAVRNNLPARVVPATA